MVESRHCPSCGKVLSPSMFGDITCEACLQVMKAEEIAQRKLDKLVKLEGSI